jgi:cytochrome b561
MTRPDTYSKLQIRLHWISVALVALQYALHDGIAAAYDQAIETGTYALSPPVIGHSAGGLIILGLAIWRLMLRRERGVPGPPEGEPEVFQKLSHWAHIGFYALLIGLPITGVMAWGGRIEAAGDIHEVLRALLILLILAHVGAVVIHQVVWKTGLITRMTRSG